MNQASKKAIEVADIKLKKSLGQNFLNDVNIVKKIAATANIDSDTTVIEIGPGIGALTEQLLNYDAQVIAIEIDERLINLLNTTFKTMDFTLFNEDFLKINPATVFEKISNKKVKVVANLPYYITTPIINRIFSEFLFVDELYVMVQKEVALRISAHEKTKKYNSLSVHCQTISDVKYEFTVKRTVFNPPPKVDSAILSFKKKKTDIDIVRFEKFIRICFTQKRKTLVNNINQGYNLNKEVIIKFLDKGGFNPKIRAEEISVKEFHKLFKEFCDKFTLIV